MIKEFFVKVKEKTAQIWQKLRTRIGRRTVAALCAVMISSAAASAAAAGN